MILNLGCGSNNREGQVGVDKLHLPGVDYVWDLENTPWPFDDESCKGIISHHVLEHINNIIPFMNEAHRILKDDCQFAIIVPLVMDESGQFHKEAFQDPTHVRFFVKESFSYFTGRAETVPYGILPWVQVEYKEIVNDGGAQAIVILQKRQVDEEEWGRIQDELKGTKITEEVK